MAKAHLAPSSCTTWLGMALAAAGGACGGGTRPAASPEALAVDQADLAPGASTASATWTPNAFGASLTVRADGGPLTDPSSPFFQSLGTNGRSCSSCHLASAGMTITPGAMQRLFARTGGTDPVFRPNDGATSPLADVSTVRARRQAYALLLARALIRVGIKLPDNAEFELVAVDDPYGYASAKELSLFRRPLPAANLAFLSAVMWDGRETFKDPNQPTGFATIHFDLADQANSATQGHAQAPSPISDAQREAILGFETQVYTAQGWDLMAGRLDAAGGQGGPWALSRQPFHFGINDTLGNDPAGDPFDPVAMTLYAGWAGARGARAAIARGQALFDSRTFDITGVGGLNDDLGIPVLRGTCTTCHDAPNAGDHSVPLPLRLGLDAPAPAGGVLDVSGLPVYLLRNLATGETVQTTDPGRALITGKWKDVGRFKGPVLRGLAARAPYFHNGSAATLEDAVRFYDTRFAIGLTDDEVADLVAFLAAL